NGSVLVNVQIDAFNSFEINRMTVTKRKVQTFALLRTAITDADESQTSFIALVATIDHIGDQSARQAMEFFVFFGVGNWTYGQRRTFLSDFDRTMKVSFQFAFGAFHLNQAALYFHLDPAWD